jgi:dehydrodolichyl diphosphate syntase complex subunit NUS1
MVSEKATLLYRHDVKARGQALTPQQREELVRPYLPKLNKPKSSSYSSQKKPPRRKPVRTFLKSQIHLLLYHLIHLVFSIYIRIKQTYHAIADRILAILYYHHRTPELIQKDVKGLSRLPEHLSVILTLDDERGGLEGLMDEVSELSAWCASAGIPVLSVYERTGT